MNKILIIGAGPAGLTAAMEILEKTDFVPIIFEASNEIGGISRTINYKGNRIDIGGHRFFSKSDWVMNWWLTHMPLADANKLPAELLNIVPDNDKAMLVRSRLSRILYLRKFFDYPISLSLRTITNLGFVKLSQVGLSYIKTRLFPIKQEKNLEDFLINRFGKNLYKTFFKDYTKKVWGVKCCEISPEWGAQRIKGLSITATLKHAFKSILKKSKNINDKNIETSLIEQFYYPKLGPGQMWELIAEKIISKGGEIHLSHNVIGMETTDNHINKITVSHNNQTTEFEGHSIISTMPIKDLIASFTHCPADIRHISNNLCYRDFITVGVLLPLDLQLHSHLVDNWIYIQEPDVKMGRLQIFNNWSPALVNSKNTMWLGLEYFANEGDELWSLSESELKKLAEEELMSLGFASKNSVLDSCVIKVPKAYPAYFGSYDEFPKVKDYINSFTNLFLIGRNGMHRYNNQDHSMLSAKHCVECIINPSLSKEFIWSTNAESEYHEEK